MCASNPESFRGPLPAIGQHFWMTGRYVLDLDHGNWAELHLLYAWSSASTSNSPPVAIATPTASNVSAQAPTANPEPALTLAVVSRTSPIPHGANATLVVQTTSAATCTITVYYKSGPETAAGLRTQTAAANGQCSWTWKVGTRTTPGTWSIIVGARLNGQSASLTILFQVRQRGQELLR